MIFTKKNACKSGVHCLACRAESVDFRKALHDAGMIDDINFTCPYGVPCGGTVADRTSEPEIDRTVSARPRNQKPPRKRKPPQYISCANYDPDYVAERKGKTTCGCMVIWCNGEGWGGKEINSTECKGEKCEHYKAKSST